jgi:hypothetical protein
MGSGQNQAVDKTQKEFWRFGTKTSFERVPIQEIRWMRGYNPSPWSIGIFNLGGNAGENLRAQYFRGEILSPRDLARCVLRVYRLRLDYDPLFQFLAQGQMSQRAVDYLLSRKAITDPVDR